MQTYHTDFPDASRKLSKKVYELKEILYNEGVLEMSGIGTLHYNMYNNYEFHPLPNGILSPSLYALETFSMTPLSMEVVEETVASYEEPKVMVPSAKKEYRLNPHWLSNAVAVAVAAILFFVLSVPVENTYIDKGNYASLGTDCLFDAIRSQSVAASWSVERDIEPQKPKNPVMPVVVKVEKVASSPKVFKEVPEVKETPKVEKTMAVKEAPKAVEPKKPAPKQAAAQKKYHIIVASLPTLADAEKMVHNYKQQGHSGATVMEGGGRFRISIDSFKDKSMAYNKLNELKQADAFKNAWMLISK
jgi:cell division septation protein DedD